MKVCVYTALFGGYDSLLDQPVADESEANFICFTDDPTLTSQTWEVRVVTPALAGDTVRSARLVKILGHPALEDYDATLYIDASVRLRATPEQILASWLPLGVDMALARHSFRTKLVDEFDEVIQVRYDDQARVYEQLTHYAVDNPHLLEAQPLWTGIIVRRRTDRICVAMRTWADHVLRYSRRDQLSVLVALDGAAFGVNVVELDNHASEIHEWPIVEGRRTSLGKTSIVPSGPLLADLRRAQVEIERLRADAERHEFDVLQEVQSLRVGGEGLSHRLDAEVHRAVVAEARVAELEVSLAHLQSLRPAAGNLRRAVARRFRRR